MLINNPLTMAWI